MYLYNTWKETGDESVECRALRKFLRQPIQINIDFKSHPKREDTFEGAFWTQWRLPFRKDGGTHGKF